MIEVRLIRSMDDFKNDPPLVCIKVNKATHHGSKTYISIGGIPRYGSSKQGREGKGREGKGREGKGSPFSLIFTLSPINSRLCCLFRKN